MHNNKSPYPVITSKRVETRDQTVMEAESQLNNRDLESQTERNTLAARGSDWNWLVRYNLLLLFRPASNFSPVTDRRPVQLGNLNTNETNK